MTDADEKVIVLMSSVHETLKMEDELESKSIAFRSVVKPRALGTDCGIALRINTGDADQVRELAETLGCSVYGIFIEVDKVWHSFER